MAVSNPGSPQKGNAEPTTHLAAIVFTDIAEQSGCEVIDAIGDGLFVLFPNP